MIYQEPPRHYFEGNFSVYDVQITGQSMDEACQGWMDFGVKYENWPSPGYKTVPGKHQIVKNTGKPARLACYLLDRMSKDKSWRDPGAASSAGTLTCKDHQTFIYDLATQTVGCYVSPIVLP